MKASFTPLHKQLPHLSKDETVMLELKTPEIHKEVQQLPPKHICVVLDTSGSMTQHFSDVIVGFNLALQKLRPEDSISVISYDTDVKLLCEWNKCSESFKSTIQKKLKDVRCNGGTNISGALLKAVEQTMKVENNNATVLFFTDGNANHGVTDINSLGTMLKRLVPANTTVHTLGYGVNHNSIFLQKCAEACNDGMYFFIENTDKLHGAFVDIIGKTFELYCQNLRLTITSEHVNFICLQKNEDFKTITLGDINLNETRKWLFKVRFTSELPNYKISFAIKGFNVIEVVENKVEDAFELTRGDDHSQNKTILDKLQLLSVSKTIKDAALEASLGNFKAATSMIRGASDRITGFPSVKKNLNQLVKDFEDNDVILNSSSHRLTSYQQDLLHDSLFTQAPDSVVLGAITQSLPNVPHNVVLGTSPIKKSFKSKGINFFPEEPTVQASFDLGMQQNHFESVSSLSRNSQSSRDNTSALLKEETPHTQTSEEKE